MSADGTILAANEEMAATYNLTQSELAGQTLVDILPTQVGRVRVNHGRTAIEENRRVAFQDSFDGKHYHNIAVSVSTAAETDSFQLITRDITEQKEREEELRMRTEELAVINRLIRHVINNDVQLLIGWSEAVAEEVDGPEREFVDRIRDTCDHIAELTGITREFVESITSDEEFELEPVDLERVVEAEVEKKRVTFEDATFTVDGSVPPVAVKANGLLSSVFGNLLNNAIRHNDRKNPTVELSAQRCDDRVAVSVADDGPGIPDDQKEIFGKGGDGSREPRGRNRTLHRPPPRRGVRRSGLGRGQ